jgi:putative hydrolase of the HAD superfamily
MQSGRWLLRQAHETLGHLCDDDGIEALSSASRDAHGLPDVQDAIRVEDHSADHFRTASLLWFKTAGLDPNLADALHAMSSDPRTHPPYPDSRDVPSSLHERGVPIGVVSDFSFELRQAMVEHDLSEFVDAVVISFEHGFQKPNPRMFTTALDLLEVLASEALMVGDR